MSELDERGTSPYSRPHDESSGYRRGRLDWSSRGTAAFDRECSLHAIHVVALSHGDLDITDSVAVHCCVADVKPSLIVNCAVVQVDESEAA